MLSKKIESAINNQINFELHSSYIYLSMAAYFEQTNLNGFANWMKIQAQEELTHAMKFFHYVHERGGAVTLEKIDAPETKWKSPLNAFKTALEHEQLVSSKINDILDIALDERDHATSNFLQWFVEEQVEEEATASDVVGQLEMVGEAKGALYHLDKEMSQRVFVDATQSAN